VPGDLRIWLLGGFRAESGGEPVPAGAWQRSGATALVKFLALSPDHRAHREQVIDVVWPAAGLTTGTGRLNKALHFARRALGAEHLRLRDDLLTLGAAGLWVDVDALEAAARRGDTEEALGLYAGELLPENRFDPWAEPRRSQVRGTVVRLLLDQAVAREARADTWAAIASLERLVAIDPLHEEAYERLMRLAAADGQRHVALRWYQRIAEALREELDVEPGDELRRLHADIAAGRLGAPAGEPRAARPGAAPAAEERKLVTVLDVDLRGAAARTGGSDPERARRETATWTDLICEVVGRWGGAAQRVVGGGVVAVFGYPVAREDHAACALWAGFEILQRVPVPVRLGADTGEVIAPDRANEATTTAVPASLPDIGGDVLDLAARLRESAGPRCLLATERTRRAVGDTAARHGDFRFGGPVRFGRPDGPPIAARRLLSAGRSAGGRPAEPEPPMVGREDEMRAVLSLVDEVVTRGRPRLLTVVGVAGVGKSRLVREVVQAAVERRPGTRVLRGRCLAAGDGITYWALGEMLRDACGIGLDETGRIAGQKLQARLRDLLRAERDAEATVFALASTAAIPLPGNPLDTAAPRDVAEQLAQAWPRFATALASGGPLVLVVEDLHWAGTPLLDMLARMVSRSAGPVVLLATARPEFLERHPGFGVGSADVSMVSLRSLTDAASRELLAGLPPARRLDRGRREEILARAEGNPYFLDQLVAHLAEGGSGALPDTLHALLAARVDALPVLEKRLLQAAAVVGRVFWVDPLRARLRGDLGPALAGLERRGLILVRPTSSRTDQTEYAFRHALLRDVAYASLPAAQRALGHADVAGWLEEISRDRIGEVIELVAVHYAAGADLVDAGPDEWIRGKAYRSLIEAGIGASRRYAVARALDLHRGALRYASNVAERAKALEAIGDDHEIAYDGDAAVAEWRSAIEALRSEPGHADQRAELCLKAAQMVVTRWGGFRVPGDPVVGDRIIDEGLAAVRDAGTRAHLLSLRALCGGRWAWTGRPDPVPAAGRRRAARDACALADRLGSPTLRGLARLGLSAVHFIENRYGDAVQAVLDVVDLVEQGGRRRDRALGHAIAGLVIAEVRGDYRRALEHAHASYTWSRELSPHDRLHGTCFVMSCLEQLGRWTEIEPYLDEHLALLQGPEAEMSCPYIRYGPLVGALALSRRGELARARELADRVPLDLDHPGNTEAWRGLVAIELGDAGTGRALAERLLRLGRRPGPEEIPMEALVLVQALEATGDHEELRRVLPTARAAAGYLATMTPTCDRAEGAALAATGDRQAATDLLTRAVDGFDRLSLPLQAARARERLAPLRPDRTDQLLQAALDAYTRLGAGPDAARARSRLAARGQPD
jgi:DNA-binding SARP family transcriptional activator